MTPIVQQPHAGIRQPDHVEQLAIDVVQIADPQIQLVAANAVDNLFRGHGQQTELQLRVFIRQRLDQLHRIQAG